MDISLFNELAKQLDWIKSIALAQGHIPKGQKEISSRIMEVSQLHVRILKQSYLIKEIVFIQKIISDLFSIRTAFQEVNFPLVSFPKELLHKIVFYVPILNLIKSVKFANYGIYGVAQKIFGH